jgi:hypothetical protein
MGTAHRLLLLIAVAMLPAGHAAAQTVPWPGDAPKAGAAAPWPGSAPSPGMSPAMGAPSPGMSPMMGAPRPMGGVGGGGGGGGMPPCMAEFAKLREDVQKKGMVAKAAGQRKVGREEMCKYITTYATAEAKWVKFTESGVQTCGIPMQVVNQLKQVHANTEQTKEKICAAGPAAAAPSLSDALGTSRLPTSETAKTGNGTLDTLTGSVIAR